MLRRILHKLVRSGWIPLSVTAGTFRLAGSAGLWWSSLASSTRADGAAIPSAYYLGFNTTDVSPSGGPDNRYTGFPLRCLSTVLDM